MKGFQIIICTIFLVSLIQFRVNGQGFRTLTGSIPGKDHPWTWEDEKKNHFRVGGAFFIFRKDSLIRYQINSNQPPDKQFFFNQQGYKSNLVFIQASGGKATLLYIPFGNKRAMLGEVSETGPLAFQGKEVALKGTPGLTNWNVIFDDVSQKGFLLNWSQGKGSGGDRPSEDNSMDIYSIDLSKKKIRLEEAIDGKELFNVWGIGAKGAAISARFDKKSYLYLVSLRSMEVKKIKTKEYLSTLDRIIITETDEIHSIPYSGDIKVLDLLTGEPKPSIPNSKKRGEEYKPYYLVRKPIPDDLLYDFDFKPVYTTGLKAGHWQSYGVGEEIINIKQGYLYICPSGYSKTPGVVVDLFQTPQMEPVADFLAWEQTKIATGKYMANNPAGSNHIFYSKEGYRVILSEIFNYSKLDEERLIVRTEKGEGIIDMDGKYLLEPSKGSLVTEKPYLLKKESGKPVEVFDLESLAFLDSFEDINFSWADFPAVKRNGKWMFLDIKSKKQMVDGQFDKIEGEAGLVLCFVGENVRGFTTKKLDEPLNVTGIKGVSEVDKNFASVKTATGYRVWIRGTKSLSESSNYQSVAAIPGFSDFCLVKGSGGYGILHKDSRTGKEELSGFDSIGTISQATLILKKAGKYGLYQGMGKPLIQFSSIRSYDPKTGLIIAGMPQGLNVFKYGSETPELNQYYGFIQHVKDTYYKVGQKPGGRIGLVSRGELLVPIGFDDISLPYKFNQEQIDVKLGNESLVYNLKKKRAEKQCKKCNGYGQIEYIVETHERCSKCFGKGWYQETRFDPKESRRIEYAVDCSTCMKKGKITIKNKRQNPCSECDQGWIHVHF